MSVSWASLSSLRLFFSWSIYSYLFLQLVQVETLVVYELTILEADLV